MNQLSHGQKINFPTSVVRSVSFEKVRQGSLSSRTAKQQHQQAQLNGKQPNANINQRIEKTVTQQSSGLCERLLNKKLLTKQCLNRKPLEAKAVQSYGNIIQNQIPKTQQIKKELQQKQMKQCTFKPKINKTTAPTRTLQQFVDQQMAYEKFKSDKVNQMREMIRAKIDKENTFQPNLIEAPEGGGAKRGASGQVHERLYEEWSKRRATADNIVAESVQKRPESKTSTIRQKLTTYSRKNSQKSIAQASQGKKCMTQVRNDPSEFNSESSKTLTVPHERDGSQTNINRTEQTSREKTQRQNSKSQKGVKITKYMDVQEVCQNKLGHRHHKNIEQKEQKKTNPKNKELYIRKILRQIGNILSQLCIGEPELTYLQMCQILQKMNFLDEHTGLNDRKYSFQIWQMLQGDVYETCPLANLVRIVFCLLGCHDFSLIQSCLETVMPDGCVARRLVLTQKESKNIKVNFQELSLNRLRRGQHMPNEPKTEAYSFKPFVSKNSSEMAQKYRKRLLQQSEQLLNQNLIEFPLAENGEVDHIDLLMLDDKCKELKMKMRRQEQEREKKRLEDEAMMGDRRAPRKKDLRIGVDDEASCYESRNEYLYELGKNTIRTRNLRQRSSNPNQLSKQCTFQPNIQQQQSQRISSREHSSSHYNSQHTASIEGARYCQPQQGEEIKDFDKSIFRMYEARRLREEIHTIVPSSRSVTQRSLLSENYVSKDRSKEEESPFLYLNVCMEGSDDIKVPVFRTDTMRTITLKVKTLMGLDNAEDAKLEHILRVQIMPTLREIGMDLEDSGIAS